MLMPITRSQQAEQNYRGRLVRLDPGAWRYSAGQVSPEYARLLSCNDPDERRSHRVPCCRLRQGSYIYTSYVWYRQLKECNPGHSGVLQHDFYPSIESETVTIVLVRFAVRMSGVFLFIGAFLLGVSGLLVDGRRSLVVYSPHGKEMLREFERQYEEKHPQVDVPMA